MNDSMVSFVASLLAMTFLTVPSLALAEPQLVSEVIDIKNKAGQKEGHAGLADVLQKSLVSYESVKDYKAIFHKTERSGGVLGKTEKIYLKFEKPFKIYMGWLNTRKKGLQVVYERGRHDGKLAIHQPGLLFGLAQVVFLDQNSPWVREGSESYNIEDAGIGTFLTDFTKAVIRADRENKLNVGARLIAPLQGENLEDKVFDVTFVDTAEDSDYFAYRVKVLFDAENNLPVAMELFDWENKTMGLYEYRDLKINVGQDPEFEKQINRKLLKVYQGTKQKTAAKTQNFAKR